MLKRSTYVVQDDQWLGPASIVMADGVKDTIAGDGGNQLLEEQQ